MKSVLDVTNRHNHTKMNMFLDTNGGLGMQRYDMVKYKQFEKLTDRQLGFFWRPEEIDILKDATDFKNLTAAEQHIFTSNLKRQILLDSVQGRSPNLAFLPIVSLPEVEAWIETWSFAELIHSRSYSHIIRNVYANPSKVFDEMLDIQEIIDCADTITKTYNDLIEYNALRQKTSKKYNVYEHKKRIWLCLMSVNILEGVRFYVSFACAWAFAELKKMEGNAKIIKFICRDENIHLASTQQMLKLLPQEDKDYQKIRKETYKQCTEMFLEAVDQEKIWSDYLFKDGSIIGLNAELLKQYVEYIAGKRMQSVSQEKIFNTGTNPLPWTQQWIAGGSVQVAPQETEISSYITGGTEMDVKKDTFKGFSL